jgi:hypothetical protein
MIIIANNNKYKLLEKYILEFINFEGNKLFGIDFEFNSDKTKGKNVRKVALCQINFVKNNKSDIFLFYPPNIKKEIFRNLLLCDCYKIIHGGESLDLPYLFDNIIENEYDRNKFCTKLIDTRYLCEYINTSINLNFKCKIYDLLLGMKVINQKKYDYLMENDKLMGNIWDIDIDINKDSFIKNKELIKYCIYDVVYLPQLFNKFKKKLPNNIIDIIIELGCKSFIIRYEKNLENLWATISKYNFDKYEDTIYNDIYIAVFEWIMTNNIMNNLYQINYFKKIIELVIKSTLYNKLNSKIKKYLLINSLNEIIVKHIDEMC